MSEIEEISYPEEYLKALKRVTPLLIAGMEGDGSTIESGTINLGRVEEDLKLPLFFFYWIAESNEVITNLNIVIADLRSLPESYLILPGSARVRFYFLVRMFFYEFYRLREIFNQVVKGLQIGGYLKKSEVPRIRKLFHDAFEHTIEIRNNLVHGSPIWKGEKHFNLMLLGGARDLGYELRSQETGEARTLSEALRDICEPTADSLRDEGIRMSKILQNLVKNIVKYTSKA